MPSLIITSLPEALEPVRLAVISNTRELVVKAPGAFASVKDWLATEYAEPAIAKRYAERIKLVRMQLRGQPGMPSRPPSNEPARPAGPSTGPAIPAVGLAEAMKGFERGVRPTDPLKGLLGSMRPPAEREEMARRVVVVSGCVLDPYADQWLSGITELAVLPWGVGGRRFEPIGRLDVAEMWAATALRLAVPALEVLGASVTVQSAAQGSAAATQPTPATAPSASIEADDQEPSINATQARVAKALASLKVLASINMIEEETERQGGPISEKTVRRSLDKLIELKLAERPEGQQGGARLTGMGRRLVSKMAGR